MIFPLSRLPVWMQLLTTARPKRMGVALTVGDETAAAPFDSLTVECVTINGYAVLSITLEPEFDDGLPRKVRLSMTPHDAKRLGLALRRAVD